MRPISMSIEGLRSFRAKVEIDFDGRDHIAIIGDTGAGKSSILEALTFALFGRTTFTGHGHQELMNDTSTSLRVVLRFTVSGQTWAVARVMRRRQEGDVGPAKASLIRYDGLQPIEQIEQVRRVNARVEKLIGLDAEAFLRTVVLPQGQFAKLLVGDDPATRSEILRQVWRTDELTAVGDAADAALDELAPLQARVAQALANEPEDPVQYHAGLQTEAHRLGALAEKARHQHGAAAEAREAFRAAQATLTLTTSVIDQVKAFDSHAHLRAARTITDVADTIAGARKWVVERQQAVRAELAAVPADDDGLTAADVGVVGATLSRLPQLVDAAAAEAAEARDAAAAAVAADAEADTLDAEAAAARQAAATHEEEGPALDAAVAAARARRDDARELLRRARQEADEASERRRQADTLSTTTGVAENHAAELAAQLDIANDQAGELRAALEEVQREHVAASAAHGLHPGDPCPICDRTLQEGWHPPAGEGLEEAGRAAQRADAEARQLSAEVIAARAKAQNTALRAEEAAAEASAKQRASDDKVGRLADLLAVDAVDLSDENLLEPFDRALAEADHAVAEFREESRRLAGKAVTAVANARSALSTAKGKQEQSVRCADRARRALVQLRDAVRSIPVALECNIVLPDEPTDLSNVDLAPLQEAERRLVARQKVLDERTRQRAHLQRVLDQLQKESDTLDRRWQQEIFGPARVFARAFDDHRDLLSRACDRLEFQDIVIPEAAGGAEPAALGRLVDVAAECARHLIGRAEARADDARRLADRASATLGEVILSLQLEPGVDHEAIVTSAASADQDARYQARAALERAERFGRRVQSLLDLRAGAQRLQAVHYTVFDLSTALKPAAFPKWLTLRRSRHLLIHASKLLEQMTAGRYSFADLSDEFADWRIIDNDSGLPRSPASLSGGEQFIASLSLALGVVEMMARSGGRLESLWLDEGFGALDRSNLDAAVEALAGVASGGRFVAVISHVRAVAEQVEHVLAVTRQITGSQARWLTATERRDVSGSDIEADVDMALSGLLD